MEIILPSGGPCILTATVLLLAIFSVYFYYYSILVLPIRVRSWFQPSRVSFGVLRRWLCTGQYAFVLDY